MNIKHCEIFRESFSDQDGFAMPTLFLFIDYGGEDFTGVRNPDNLKEKERSASY